MAETASAWSPVAVKALVDVPEAVGRLAVLVLEADLLRPRTAGWLGGLRFPPDRRGISYKE